MVTSFGKNLEILKSNLRLNTYLIQTAVMLVATEQDYWFFYDALIQIIILVRGK